MVKPERLWCDPEFARAIKINARIEGLNLIDYTKKISGNLKELTEKKLVVENKIKGTKYEFKF